jgi:transposase
MADMEDMGIATQDTRELALAAVEAGDVSLGQIATLFKVHRTTLYRWIRTHQQSGRTAPLASGNRRATYTRQELKRLDQLVSKHPDATLQEHRDAMGKPCSIMAVHRALHGLGWRYKKNGYVRLSKTDPM